MLELKFLGYAPGAGTIVKVEGWTEAEGLGLLVAVPATSAVVLAPGFVVVEAVVLGGDVSLFCLDVKPPASPPTKPPMTSTSTILMIIKVLLLKDIRSDLPVLALGDCSVPGPIL